MAYEKVSDLLAKYGNSIGVTNCSKRRPYTNPSKESDDYSQEAQYGDSCHENQFDDYSQESEYGDCSRDFSPDDSSQESPYNEHSQVSMHDSFSQESQYDEFAQVRPSRDKQPRPTATNKVSRRRK